MGAPARARARACPDDGQRDAQCTSHGLEGEAADNFDEAGERAKRVARVRGCEGPRVSEVVEGSHAQLERQLLVDDRFFAFLLPLLPLQDATCRRR